MISTLGIYFTLLFFSNFLKINFFNEQKINRIDLFLIFILAIFLFFTLPTTPIDFGSGIISKLIGVISIKLNLDWNIVKYIYFFINLLFVGMIILLV